LADRVAGIRISCEGSKGEDGSFGAGDGGVSAASRFLMGSFFLPPFQGSLFYSLPHFSFRFLGASGIQLLVA